jgi:hypothetical protein
MSRESIEKVVGAFFFVAFICTHLLFGITDVVRVLGVACAVAGAVWIIGRSVPVGFEERPPSFFLRGAGALIAGVAMAGLGVALLLYPEQAACLLGWASGTECSVL